MTMKITTTLENEDEKSHFHSNRLLMFLLQKKLTALSDFFFYLLEVMPLSLQEAWTCPSCILRDHRSKFLNFNIILSLKMVFI